MTDFQQRQDWDALQGYLKSAARTSVRLSAMQQSQHIACSSARV